MSDDPQIPELSPAMLADLMALERGEAPPERAWYERPWKVGEPCWVAFIGPANDIHIYPGRVVAYDPEVMAEEANFTPLVQVSIDPVDDFPMTALDERINYRLVRAMPRIVEGESW